MRKDEISGGEYWKIHRWLEKHYGKPDKCEMKDCKGISKTFAWALLRDKSYDYNRENFKRMCASCHSRYDVTDETRQKKREIAIKNDKASTMRRGLWKTRIPVPCPHCGMEFSKNTPGQKYCGNFRNKTGCSYIAHKEYQRVWYQNKITKIRSHKNT